jgi:50S ribosomal protein L16 3-hydroxylase
MHLLGGLSPRTFLRRYWQKRPLLVRAAVPQFTGVLELRALARLAARNDVESRIVERRRGGRKSRWVTAHGPFPRFHLKKRDATVLVSGLNFHLSFADALLRRFAFVPQARLDDVMVSYATPGGGVGPHVDSYDVFLLQGAGRRRWRYWFQRKPHQCVVGPGDLLYLPPGVKHDGVALEPCFTYSIGFRAPRAAELGAAFLDWLHRRGLPDARYRDPGLRPARRAARIPPGLVRFARGQLARIRWSAGDVATFLGEYLTEPKAHVVFRPARPARRRRAGATLDPKTQLLYSGTRFFLNGEPLAVPRRARPALRALADRRRLGAAALARSPLRELIYDWQRLGYVRMEKP